MNKQLQGPDESWVATFLEALGDNYRGILVLLLALAVLAFIIDRLAKTFNWGRYDSYEDGTGDITYLISQFFTKIINDFRHFLALILVIFLLTIMLVSLVYGSSNSDRLETFQAVVSSLMGLLGSVVGYYFGETSVTRITSNKKEKGTKNELRAKEGEEIEEIGQTRNQEGQ